MKPRQPLQIEYYVTTDGTTPFQLWFDALKDKTAQARILVRLERLSAGNPGDHKGIGMEDAFELRIPHGKGFRIYFGVWQDRLVVLLCGGDKQSKTQQADDIAQALTYWTEYLQRMTINEQNS